jgi:hypothetical protein
MQNQGRGELYLIVLRETPDRDPAQISGAMFATDVFNA